jgi:hypothetical protein
MYNPNWLLEEKYERSMFLFISLFQKKYEFIDFINSWKEVKNMNNKVLVFNSYIREELLPQKKLSGRSRGKK